MSFLHPWALAVGLLAAVPVALHLVRREMNRRVPFPALRYLRSAQQRTARSLQMRDRLLLLTRVALLLAVALAAAVPLVGRGGAADHRPTDVLLLIDNSASMSRLEADRPALKSQLERASATLAFAGPDDRFWIYPTVGPPVAAGAGRRESERAISRVQATDGRGYVARTAREALRLIPGDVDRFREVHLYGDLQAGDFRDEPLSGIADGALVVSRSKVGQQVNEAVVSVELSTGSRAGFGKVVDLAARVESYPRPTAVPPDTIPLRLELDGETVALVPMAAGSEAILRLPTMEPGEHGGKVAIPPSSLRADDSRYFTLRVEPPPAVLHLGAGEGFVERALETLEADGRIARTGESEVVVVEGVPRHPGDLSLLRNAEALVLVPPSDELDLPPFNQLLGSLDVPWRLAGRPARGGLRLVAEDGSELARARVSEVFAFRRLPVAGGRDSALIRTEDGKPWLVRGTAGKQAYVLLASPLSSQATSLPLSVSMIPFVEALLRWGHLSGWPESGLDVGESVRLPARADSVRGTDGATTRVDGGALFRPLEAGVYRVFQGGTTRTRLFAANIPTAESDLETIRPGALNRLFPDLEVVVAGTDDEWEEAIFRARRGTNVAIPLIILAVLLLGAEALLVVPPRRDSDSFRRHATGTERSGRKA